MNHLSFLDAPLVATQLPRPVVMFAAEEMRRVPVVSWFLTDLTRTIWVKRGEGDREALEAAASVLEGGGAVALGPEGTRSKARALLPGKTGVAGLATRTGVPVVPLAAWGHETLTRDLTRLKRGAVHVRVAPPLLFPRGEASGAELRAYTDQVMRALAGLLPREYRGAYEK